MDTTHYKISYGRHHDQDVIFFEFPNKNKLKNELRQFLPVKWSQTHKKWYALDIPSYRERLNLAPRMYGDSLLYKIHAVNIPAYKAMQQELILKAYSPHTMKTYLTEFAHLLWLLRDKPLADLTTEQLRAYMVYCSQRLKLSEATLHSRLNAINFYYQYILKSEIIKYDIPRPKKKSSLPKVLSKSDIAKMFKLIENPKHQLILKLVYGMGLRVSEIVALKLTNIDAKRMLVHIENAKGKKDRYVTLPQSILPELRAYYKNYRPQTYLFEGQSGGQYSIRSVQAIFKTAMDKAKIKKAIGVHGLRHSYATHLMEAGTDMVFIQKLLGHQNIKTTMIYAKVGIKDIAKVESPLDTL